MDTELSTMGHAPLLANTGVEVSVTARRAETYSAATQRMQSSELGEVVPMKASLREVAIYLLCISVLATGCAGPEEPMVGP